MLVNLKNRYIILFFFNFCFLSCAKKDNDAPVISIISPMENTSYQLPASIVISGNVIDDHNINNIKINIVDENQSPISTEINITIDSLEYQFEESFQINERLLNSGTYYVNVKAFDEENNLSSSYRSIQISEIPRVLKSIYFLTQGHFFTYLYQLTVGNGFVITENIHLKDTELLTFGISTTDLSSAPKYIAQKSTTQSSNEEYNIKKKI